MIYLSLSGLGSNYEAEEVEYMICAFAKPLVSQGLFATPRFLTDSMLFRFHVDNFLSLHPTSLQPHPNTRKQHQRASNPQGKDITYLPTYLLAYVPARASPYLTTYTHSKKAVSVRALLYHTAPPHPIPSQKSKKLSL